ncbi:hypothetical protein F2Q68_00037846 [Brassica cretica]|uniref:Uncharacterized protein n=1 Tax=Brassica cretica TaxID=69181 RepID=A0A8S9HA37_BRACR|nr:hypothetical protein F2Q68_00037846 [Brassica cretica]
MRKVEASPSPLLPRGGVAAVDRVAEIVNRSQLKYQNSHERTSCPLSWLPYEVALLCLARVRRCDHPALSLLFHKIRSKMGITDTEVYLCLRTPPDANPGWYILRRSSNLIPIAAASSFPSQHLESSAVALGSAIYVIGGRMINGIPTSDVSRLDCRTHTWRRVPSMGVARASPAAAVGSTNHLVLYVFTDDALLGYVTYVYASSTLLSSSHANRGGSSTMNLIEKQLKRRAKRAVAKILERRVSMVGEASSKTERSLDGIDMRCKVVDFGNACWAHKQIAEEIQTRPVQSS